MDILLETVVVLAVIFFGARASGIGLGMWGGVGLLALVYGFGLPPTAPPTDVMLIILAVVSAASVMDACGGIDYLVRVAARIIRSNPKHVTIIAPLVTWAFTSLAGTGHVIYPLMPVIYEVAIKNGIRPERPMAVSTIGGITGITSSPVAAATAALLGLVSPLGYGLADILMVSAPATLAGMLAAGIVSMFIGKDLDKDPEYQGRLAAGLVQVPVQEEKDVPVYGRRAALIFIAGVLAVIVAGMIPSLRRVPGTDTVMSMATLLEIFMLFIATVISLTCRPNLVEAVKTPTMRAGITALIGIFGLAWLGDTFIAAHKELLLGTIGEYAKNYPWTFALVLFFTSVVLYSQGATTRTIMPIGLAMGLPAPVLFGMFPAINANFFLPTYGLLVAAMAFDRSGTTRIGKFVFNHSFMIPGLVSVVVSVAVGLFLAGIVF